MEKRYFLCVLIACALFFSCNDGDDDPIILPVEYRVSEIIYVDDGLEEKSKTVFTYTDEKLTLRTWYRKDDGGEWTEDYKDEFAYNGNLVTQTSYRKNDLNWTISRTQEFTFQNDLMTESLNSYYNDGAPRGDKNKHEYSFNGTLFTGYNGYYGTSVLEIVDKGEASYTNNVLTKFDYFNFSESGWQNHYTKDFIYSGDLLTEIVSSIISGSTIENNEKIVYTYTGGLISSMERLYWRNDAWESSGTYNYIYNSDNYLIEMNYNNSSKYVVTYEEGKGNTYNLVVNPLQQIFKNPFAFHND